VIRQSVSEMRQPDARQHVPVMREPDISVSP